MDKTYDGGMIRRMMNRQGFTIDSLAALARVGRSTVERAVRLYDASVATMARLAVVLGGTPVDYHVGGPGADALIDRLEGGQSLSEVVGELLAWEHAAHPIDELTVKNLAIDQADGWPVIQAALNLTVSKRLAIDAVMLNPDLRETGRLPNLPPEVLGWAAAGAANLDVIRLRLQTLPAGLKPFRLRIKFYTRVPTVHGILIRTPHGAMVARSRCETRPGTPPAFTHGPSAYRTYSAAGADACPELQQYETLFDELWAERNDLALDFRFRYPADSGR